MRVLHVTTSLGEHHGGPSMALAGLAMAQVGIGVETRVLTTWRNDEAARPLEEKLRNAGVAVTSVGPGHGPLVRHPDLAAAVSEQLRTTDVIHIHSLWEEAPHLAAKLARDAGIPYIIEPNGMLTPWSLAQKWWKKKLSLLWRVQKDLDRAAALHFSSQAECEASAGVAGGTPTIVEPIGITVDEFRDLPPRGTFRARYPQIGKRPVIAFLGRIHAGKGLEHLIPAIPLLDRVNNADPILVVAGPDGGLRAAMETKATDLGIKERVLFTGQLDAAERLLFLADAELFCLPSDHENFGIVVIEALAAGTQVVISRHVGVQKEVNAIGGAIVAQDARSLAAELNRWLGDEPARRAVTERARHFVLEHYDWRIIAGRWVEHYRRLKS